MTRSLLALSLLTLAGCGHHTMVSGTGSVGGDAGVFGGDGSSTTDWELVGSTDPDPDDPMGGCLGCIGEQDLADESATEPMVSDGLRGGFVAGGTYSASSDDPCRTLHPTIRGTAGADTITGTPHRDIIFAGAGDDTIDGRGGDDVICAGGGEDHVEGGDGNDYIDGGFGSDTINAGPGDDVVHGRSGGDTIHGQEGNDRIYGDLLDDHLFGDNGDDLIVGGHGVDEIDGGAGDDWLRGDTNNDDFVGGYHVYGDTISFATATPPGQPLGMLPAMSGVIVNAQDAAMGWASGDGKPETITTTERFVGSAFDDMVIAGPSVTHVSSGFGNDVLSGNATFDAAPGSDTCNGAACADAAPGPGDAIVVMMWNDARDPGLGVIGSSHDDAIGISVAGRVARVEARGAPMVAGPGCDVQSATVITCTMPSVISFVMAYGGAGRDEIHLDGRFPRDMEATIDGGEGDDVLDGHDGQDILFAGHQGNDQLNGTNGDDALISESQDRDVMSAGSGNDQLVTNWPCGHHEYIGGPGMDVAGFARVGNFDTAAERARQSIHAQIGGPGFQPSFCAEASATNIHFDTEILEGAGGDDVLRGFDGDHDEIFWGREGDDVIMGYGGNDTIEGLSGNDEIHGGPGRDRLRGGDGNDTLFAADGEADVELSVSGAGCVHDRDPSDPQGARMCN